MALVPVMRMRPDFLNVEGNPAAEIHGLVFLRHAKVLIVLEGLKRRAIVAHVVETPLDDDQILIDLRGRTPVPVVLVARVCSRQAVLRAEQVYGAGFAVVSGPDTGLGAILGRQRVV